MEARVIDRGGTQLHGLWRAGEGETLIVLPGVMADATAFEPVIKAIDLPNPVLILNRRGRLPSGSLGDGYSIQTEVEDLRAWLDHVRVPVTVFGWSYGATIALEAAATDSRIRQTIGYEPVLPPFGIHALPALQKAGLDRRVEIVNIEISRVPQPQVDELRATPAWPILCRLAEPLPDELAALNAFEPNPGWSQLSAELILGEQSQGAEPYGPAFERVTQRLGRSNVTLLPEQGHLAHATDPQALGRTVADLLRNCKSEQEP